MLSSPFALEIQVVVTRASKTGLQTYTHVMRCQEVTTLMKLDDVRVKMLKDWDGPGEAAEIFRDGVFASMGPLNCPVVHREHYPGCPRAISRDAHLADAAAFRGRQ